MTLFDIAVQYQVRCELFDRTVCRHRTEHGSAIPLDGYASMRVAVNAQTERTLAIKLGRVFGHHTQKDVEEAIRSEPVHREAERILRELPDESEPGELIII